MKALVISNATLESDEVYSALAEHRTRNGLESVHVVAPVSLRDTYPWEAAKERMDAALLRLQRMGFHATGALGDNDPFVALEHALEMGVYDRILITTLKSDGSRWLRMDLISRASRLTDTPVERVATSAGWSAAAS